MAQKLFGPTKPAEKDAAAQANQSPPENKEPMQTAAAVPQPAVPAGPVTPETPAEEKKIFPAEAEEMSRAIRPEFRPHAFVVMPFGKKKGGDGSPYDFNAIYKLMIKPAL